MSLFSFFEGWISEPSSDRRKKRRSRPASRRCRLERLEDRQMLSYTATLAGTTATFTGNAAGDTITFDVQTGLLRHNRFTAGDAGFASDTDFDSALAGTQTLAASAANTVDLITGAGADIVNLGTATVAASALLAAFTVDNAGGGADVLNIDDSVSAVANTVTVSLGSVLGTGIFVATPAAISGGVTVRTGSVGDTVNVTGTALVANPTPINLFTNGGSDTINISDPTNSLSDIVQPITIDGGAGTDVVNINDSGNGVFAFYQINPTTISRDTLPNITTNNTVETRNLSGGSFGNVYSIAGVSTGTNLTGGAGNDAFSFDAGSSLGGTINGGAGTDTLDYTSVITPVAVNLSTQVLLAAQLNGAAVKPNATNSTAFGQAVMLFNPTGNLYDFAVDASGIALPNLTGSGIRVGTTAQNSATNVVDLGDGSQWSLLESRISRRQVGTPQFVFPTANVASLLAGNTYVTINTTAFAGGEIRGQLNVVATAGTATGTTGISNFENVIGGGGNDAIVGDDNPNVLSGLEGDDILFGLGGVDTLNGGAGNDLLIGGQGNDGMFGGDNTPQFVALSNGNTLARFSQNTINSINEVTITGLANGETIRNIDFRPANGLLYGVSSANRLYTINVNTGAATAVGNAGAFTVGGAALGMDFNPQVDRLRLVTDTDQNLRVNPNDGSLTATDTNLAYAAGDANFGQNPNIVGSAYSNNFVGATATTLFGIDSNRDVLVTQNPNTGALTTVGSLGIDVTNVLGFDIFTPFTGLNFGYFTAVVNGLFNLYTVNLTSGVAQFLGTSNSANPLSGLSVAIDAGNDVLVWNNGDGSDLIDGGGGRDRVEVNGSENAVDIFSVGVNNGVLALTRTGTGPFGLTLYSAEVLDVKGGANNGDGFTSADLGTATSLQELSFDGGGGLADGAGISNRATTDVLLANYPVVGASTLTGPTGSYRVDLVNVELTSFSGGVGDIANLYDSPGDDTLYASLPVSGMFFPGGGQTVAAIAFPTVYAFSTAGADAASIVGTTGADIFSTADTAAGAVAILYNGTAPGAGGTYAGYTMQAINFKATTAGGGGGADQAYLGDSAFNDAFVGTPTSSHILLDEFNGQGTFTVTANSFPTVFATSTGGADTATFYDSTATDNFTSYVSGTDFISYLLLGGTANVPYYSAKNFSQVVVAHSGTAVDNAVFNDSPMNDTLGSNGTQVSMNYGALNPPTHTVTVTAFGNVYANGLDGQGKAGNRGVNKRIGTPAATVVLKTDGFVT